MGQYIGQADIIADMHVHTIASVGGLSTLRENLLVARNVGVEIIAITNLDICNSKNDINELKRVVSSSGVQVVSGIEYTDMAVSIDGPSLKLAGSGCKWNMFGYHPTVHPHPVTFQAYIDAITNVCMTLRLSCLAHPQNELLKIFEKDDAKTLIAELATMCASFGMYFEVNLSHSNDEEEWLLDYVIGEMADNEDFKVVLGSGAHYCEEIGRFEKELRIINSYAYTKNRILNTNREEILSRFN